MHNAHLKIVIAQPQHLDSLPEIEREATQLFVGYKVPACVIDGATSPEEFVQLQRKNLLWVALLNENPVGFAVVEFNDDVLHLEELDVHPRVGRQGIGSAIVNTLCDWATQNHYCEVTLTTYRDIPWNAPFYGKLGFVVVAYDDLSESLKTRVQTEAARGLESERRVVMRKFI